MEKISIKSAIFILLVLIIASCQGGQTDEGTQPAVEQNVPTPTEAPVAARVNGEGIWLSDYEEELSRYQSAVEDAGMAFEHAIAKDEVINELIDQVLLAQSAVQEGFSINDAVLQARMDELAAQSGGAEKLNQWMKDNYFTPESFRRALARDMAVVWMRNRILDSVPVTADQVHARQILVRSENEAIAAERRLQVGTDFTALAFEYDSLTGGELGWFPAGYLLQPDVEAAAFSLQPGQFSGIIPTSYGFHIVFVIERDPNHPLSGEALLQQQRAALEQWLDERRAQGSIEIYID
jgi:peptidyl-prolyl cis-trans isomerase C